MSSYGTILRALTRRIGLFTLLLLSIPLTVRLVGLYEPNPIASMVTLGIGLPTILWFTGGLLGNAASGLLNLPMARLVPGYSRKVLTVVIVLGMALWSLVPLYYASGGFAVDKIVWLRWVPLWSYGLLGQGFIAGFLAPGQGPVFAPVAWSRLGQTRMGLLTLMWLLPVLFLASTSLRQTLSVPLSQDLPGLTPLALICLAIGPLSWFSIARWLTPPPSAGSEIKLSMTELLRAGVHGSWGLPSIAARLHSPQRPRIEFLVYQPTLLNLPVAPLFVAAWFLVFGGLYAGLSPTDFNVIELFRANAPALQVAMLIIPLGPVYTGTIDLPRLGQGLLLPGQFRRPSLPSHLFKRLLTLWIGGAALALAPLAAFAWWMGTALAAIGWFAIVLVWGLVLAAAVEFFRAPTTPRKTPNDPVRIGMAMGLILVLNLAKPFFFDVYTAGVCLAVIALAFVLPWALYRQGLKRWQTLEYGA